jgi:hypothetical protein
MGPEAVFAFVFLCGIAAGVFVIYLGLKQQSLHNEMRHRERMAMIERGQVPLEHAPGTPAPDRLGGAANSRSLSIGIIVMGFGLAVAMLVGFAGGATETAVGVGGAITILGASFVVRSLVVKPVRTAEDSARNPSTGL